MNTFPRVAFLPDTFQEVNGVAHTSRNFEAFARRRNLPFFSAHPGKENKFAVDGNVTLMELARGPARIGLDSNLDYDVFLLRHASRVAAELQRFSPDLIHLTGPGDMGMLGCYLARRFRVPLVISWHTSLHEYAGRRLERLTGFLGGPVSHTLGCAAEDLSLRILAAFYRQAAMVMAPNPELVTLTRALTGKPVSLMQRGVDTELFHPGQRSRSGGPFRIGYVGRLTAEKNVRLLAALGKKLLSEFTGTFELQVVGEGSERAWLADNVPNVRFAGVLRNESLARAYADMDLFVFPSLTDTYGNVILEALASGVPAVVTNSGGPKFLVVNGVTGYIANTDAEFIRFVGDIMRSSGTQAAMSVKAREHAMRHSWDAVFESVYTAYREHSPSARAA